MAAIIGDGITTGTSEWILNYGSKTLSKNTNVAGQVSFTGTCTSAGILTVSSITGNIVAGTTINGNGIPYGTIVGAIGASSTTGTGGNGTYQLINITTSSNISITAITTSEAMTGVTRHTVNELYSWLMSLFSNAAEMDDTVPIQANTPTEYQLINGWTFNSDSTDTQYLYGGSIIVIKGGGNDIWANFYTLGSIDTAGVVYWEQGTSAVATYTGYVNGHIDQLIKVTNAGTDISSKNVTAYLRNLGDTYGAFQVQATATGGRNPVPLATSSDINDTGSMIIASCTTGGVLTVTGVGTNPIVAGQLITGTNIPGNSVIQTFGTNSTTGTGGLGTYQLSINPTVTATSQAMTASIYLANAPVITFLGSPSNYDIGDGDGAEPYYVTINGNGNTCLQVYQYLKYITNKLNTNATGTGTTVEGCFYQAAQNYSPITAAPFGSFAGSTFFGAQGVWILAGTVTDLKNMQLKDNNGLIHNPPVTMTVSVTGVSSGDRVFVAKATSGDTTDPNKSEFQMTAGAGSGVITVASVPADTPSASGSNTTLRIGDNVYSYTGTTATTFTGVAPIGSSPALNSTNYPTGTYFYVPLIDTVVAGSSSFTITATVAAADNGILNVTATTGTIVAGQILTGVGITTGTTILAFGTNGTSGSGGTGNYQLSIYPTAVVSSESMTLATPLSNQTITSPNMTYVSSFPIIARVRQVGILPFQNTGTVTNNGASISAIRTTDTIVNPNN